MTTATTTTKTPPPPLSAEEQAKLDYLMLLVPLAEQILALALGQRRSKMSEQQIRRQPDQKWLLMADHVAQYMKARGVGLVKLQ